MMGRLDLAEVERLADGIDFKSLWIAACGDKNDNPNVREFVVALVNAYASASEESA